MAEGHEGTSGQGTRAMHARGQVGKWARWQGVVKNTARSVAPTNRGWLKRKECGR